MFPLAPFPSLEGIALFALVLGRTTGIFSAIPLFGGKRVPLRVRVLLILCMTLVLFPILPLKGVKVPADAIGLVLMVAQEATIGISLSLLSLVIFAAVELGGQIVGMQMGFTISSQFDPAMGQSSVVSAFQGVLAALLFLVFDIHHFFIRALVESYTLLPLGSWHMDGRLVEFAIASTGWVFLLGVKLAAPVMVSLLMANVALGIMARAFPQMNIFMVSLPVTIGLGLIVLGLSLSSFVHILSGAFGAIPLQMKSLFVLLAGG
ncbi:MAG TPA: flagellar biosynthetic protein FliR [Geobacterales bacterium]|nr:flagellar biosynthetic protein FliR [Geobacterales bacterium]